jgi:hypothetical protein
MGSATYAFPAGISANTTLKLGLDSVTGPFETGPVVVDGAGIQRRLINHLGRRVSCDQLVSRSGQTVPVNAVLDARTTLTVTVPDGGSNLVADCTVDTGFETLDEVRAYVEDLQLGVVFIASGALTGATSLEIGTTFLGAADALPIVLTSARRQAERKYVLPLTAYASDPVLQFTVTAVTADGTRTTAPAKSWPVRTRGVLIAVDTPSSTPD